MKSRTAKIRRSGRTWIQDMAHKVRRMLSFVWPDECPVCNKTMLANESPLCLDCLAGMPRIDRDLFLTYIGPPQSKVTVITWFVYNQSEKSHILIHHIKYHDRFNLARKLGREFALQKLIDRQQLPDIILPIPLHWTKHLKRGYNQTREIAEGIRDVTNIPVGRNLYAARSHDSQTSRSRLGRVENVRNIFAVRRPGQLDGKHIAILDDVITTGSTMLSALETILKVSRPASVTFLSLAKTQTR